LTARARSRKDARAMSMPRDDHSLSRGAVALAIALTLTACESAPEKPGREPPPRPAAQASATASASAAQPAPPALTAQAAPNGATGAWEGRYEAKKGEVALPPKVKDKAIAADDGKVASGPGTVEITIAASGDIRGKVSGALGPATVTGKLDGEMIRAGVQPDDPFASHAMTGILVGSVKGESLACELHVAGPDGTQIREAKIDLSRKK
jgi:hypothetical protein